MEYERYVLAESSSVRRVVQHVDTVPLALFERLDLSFLKQFPCSPPIRGGEHGKTKHWNCSRDRSSLANSHTSVV